VKQGGGGANAAVGRNNPKRGSHRAMKPSPIIIWNTHFRRFSGIKVRKCVNNSTAAGE